MSQTSTYILDGMTRHQIFVQRLGSQYANELMPLIESMVSEINSMVSVNMTTFQLFQLIQTGGELNKIIEEATGELNAELTAKLDEFARYESGYTARLLSEATTFSFALPAAEVISAAVSNSVMELVSGKSIERLTIDGMLSSYAKGQEDKVKRAIQSGIISGQSNAEIMREVSSVTGRSVSDARAIVRTATNHVASEAKRKTYLANTDAIRGEEWISILDHRTSAPCRSLDGTIFEVGQGVYPPRHYGCRSTRQPLTESRYNKRIKDAKSGSENDKTYGQWLKRQPKSTIVEILGPTRAELFIKGGLKIDKFTDDQQRTYTLDELRALDPDSFELAGLE